MPPCTLGQSVRLPDNCTPLPSTRRTHLLSERWEISINWTSGTGRSGTTNLPTTKFYRRNDESTRGKLELGGICSQGRGQAQCGKSAHASVVSSPYPDTYSRLEQAPLHWHSIFTTTTMSLASNTTSLPDLLLFTAPPSERTLNWTNVAIAFAFVFLDVVTSFAFGLGIGTSLLSAAARCVVQLSLVAVILRKVFESNSPWVVAFFAGRFSFHSARRFGFGSSSARGGGR